MKWVPLAALVLLGALQVVVVVSANRQHRALHARIEYLRQHLGQHR
jgi:ribosomal protein S15P/S13E